MIPPSGHGERVFYHKLPGGASIILFKKLVSDEGFGIFRMLTGAVTKASGRLD
jgi:hypothetical protein